MHDINKINNPDIFSNIIIILRLIWDLDTISYNLDIKMLYISYL